MAKFIKTMPNLSNSEVKDFLIDLSKPDEVTEEERKLIKNVRNLKKNVGSPIEL